MFIFFKICNCDFKFTFYPIYFEQFNPSKILLKRIWTTAPSSPVAVKENTLSVPHLHAPIMPPACESSESDLVTKAIYS